MYHGGASPDVPPSFEWLAFEIEHAENFARDIRPVVDVEGKGPAAAPGPSAQQPLRAAAPPPRERRHVWLRAQQEMALDGGRPKWPALRPGYLHTYRAVRPLRLLYIDGMAAAKTEMGTLDTQDLVLRGNQTGAQPPWKGELARATELCALARAGGAGGLVRMEPGFEVIYCDFADGALVQDAVVKGPPAGAAAQPDPDVRFFEWMRTAASRYHGIGGARVALDYSSMVSAYFYPVDLTNPDTAGAAEGLPRLVSASADQLAAVKRDVGLAIRRACDDEGACVAPAVDWQAVTDMTTARYAERLRHLVQPGLSLTDARSILDVLLNLFIDYSEASPDLARAEAACVAHTVPPAAHPPTLGADELIRAGLEATAGDLCTTLFQARAIVVEAEATLPVPKVQDLIAALMGRLRWAEWSACRGCQSNELCFVAMWPFGKAEHHRRPSCLNASTLSWADHEYWY